jgi:ribosomal protein S18 acetylase RimI-like enzyme
VTIEVEVVTSASTEVVSALARLVPQLSSSAPPVSERDVAEIVATTATTLLVARDEGAIVGTLTLVLFRIPGGPRAWIEDVITDEAARGRGVGEALTRAAIELAQKEGARSVDLTSRPSREAANRLYRRLGFALRETNVYRLSFDG